MDGGVEQGLLGVREVRGVGEVRWQELTKQECFELLAGQQLGQVVLVDDRGPLALPVNYVVDQHSVLFRTDEGTKLEVASRGARVAFEVDGAEEATRTGWSVLVRGRPWRSPTRPNSPGCAGCRCRPGRRVPGPAMSGFCRRC